MVSHHPLTFGGQRHCGCGCGDILFSLAEKEDSRCSLVNLLSLFISKGYGLKAHTTVC